MYYSIPDDVLDKIVAHRPHLSTLAHNLRAAGSRDAARQIERPLADNYLSGATCLTPLETWHLAACAGGRRYGDH